MNFTKIKKWWDEHPDTYVDIHISLRKIIGKNTIKLKMQKNHSKPIYRTSTDIENDISLIPATLDEMYKKCITDESIPGYAGEDIKEGGVICQHADDKWYNEKTTSIEPMLNSWAEYVATYSYLTIEEAEKLYPLCKSINMQREQAIALLQSKGDLELLYYTITHEGMIS